MQVALASTTQLVVSKADPMLCTLVPSCSFGGKQAEMASPLAPRTTDRRRTVGSSRLHFEPAVLSLSKGRLRQMWDSKDTILGRLSAQEAFACGNGSRTSPDDAPDAVASAFLSRMARPRTPSMWLSTSKVWAWVRKSG